MSNGEPKTVRELYFYMKGEFHEIRTEIGNIKKITYWVAGITGSVISGIVVTLFKLFGGIE